VSYRTLMAVQGAHRIFTLPAVPVSENSVRLALYNKSRIAPRVGITTLRVPHDTGVPTDTPARHRILKTSRIRAIPAWIVACIGARAG